MSNNSEQLNLSLDRFLRGAGVLAPANQYFDSSGEGTTANDAEVFKCQWVKDDKNYDDFYVSVDGSKKLIVYYDDSIANSPKHVKDGTDNWYGFITDLRNTFFSKLKFELKPNEHLGPDMQQRAHLKKLDEGYYSMGKTKSYSDNIPETKIIIQHNRALEEGEQRYRNVARIFIENAIGERTLAPTTKPGLARTFARHIAEGGKPNDERWNHITSLCEEYQKMAGFVRATRGNQFNESAQRLVTEGINHYQNLRETLHKLTSKKGYGTYFESYSPPLMEDEEQQDLSEMFMSSSLDPRIESVMPILSKLSKNISETKDLAEVIELEEWADSITEFSAPEKVNELSNEKLGQYKKAASDDASAADAAGDMKRGDKRFNGIVKATIKQLANDVKKHYNKEQEVDEGSGLGYSQDPEQGKWYHEGRKAYKFGTTGNLIQDIAKKHNCPPEWLKAFHAGYQDQEGWGKDDVSEDGKGLWANIHAKRKRIKSGSGELMRKPGSKGAPTADALKKSATEGMAAGSLKEFAPVGGDDREPNEEEILRQLAAQWWNGTEQQMAKAQNTLASMGWEIGQDESGDDDAGVFVIRAGDINGNSYMSFNHSDLNLNEGEQRMSRAAKGIMKYGKKGMKKLADLGREGASEEEMDDARDEFDKYNKKGVAENLDGNQKSAGQWGPTGRPVKPGDLVGVSEGQQDLDAIKRLLGK